MTRICKTYKNTFVEWMRPCSRGFNKFFFFTDHPFSSFLQLSFLKVYFVNEYSKPWPWMHSHFSKLVDRNSPSLSLSSPSPELCLIIINAIIRKHYSLLSFHVFFSLSICLCLAPLTPHRWGLGEIDMSLCLSDQCCFSCLQVLSGSFLSLYWNLINF